MIVGAPGLARAGKRCVDVCGETAPEKPETKLAPMFRRYALGQRLVR